MKADGTLMLFIATVLLSCREDSIKSRTDLLVDVQWHYIETVGASPSGFAVVSPLVFGSDNTFGTGEWRFIDKGRAIEITFPNSNHSNRYEIVILTEAEFRFKHYDGSGNFLAEVKYGKCNPTPTKPC